MYLPVFGFRTTSPDGDDIIAVKGASQTRFWIKQFTLILGIVH